MTDFGQEFDSAVPAQKPTTDFGAEFDAAAPSAAYDVAASGAAGVGKGMSHFLGAAGDVRSMASKAADVVGNAFGASPETMQSIKDIGSKIPMSVPLLGAIAHGPSSEDVQHGIESATGEFHKPQTTAGQYAQTTADFVSNPATYLGGEGSLLTKGLMGAASGVGSEAAGQALKGSDYEGLGRLGGALLAGPLAGRALQPNMQLGADQAALARRGVQMTPGQMMGGQFKNLEDRATSWPILGPMIKNARGRSTEDFNRSVADQALLPIAESVERETPAGHEMVGEVRDKLSNAYDQVIPNLHFVPDHEFSQDMMTIRRDAMGMPASDLRTFNRIIADRLAPNRWIEQQLEPPLPNSPNMLMLRQRFPSIWGLQGEQYKSVESELTNLAGRYGSSSDAGHQLLGQALGRVVTAMRGNLERINPEYAGVLHNINTGYAIYARIRDAAARRVTSQGVYTPGDLLAAIKKGDKTVGKGAFARGDAMMQPYAGSAQKVLPSTVPNSGTADRASLFWGLPEAARFAWAHPLGAVGAVAAGALGALPYSTLGQRALNAYVRQPSGPIGQAVQRYGDTGRGLGAFRPLLQTSPFGQ